MDTSEVQRPAAPPKYSGTRRGKGHGRRGTNGDNPDDGVGGSSRSGLGSGISSGKGASGSSSNAAHSKELERQHDNATQPCQRLILEESDTPVHQFEQEMKNRFCS